LIVFVRFTLTTEVYGANITTGTKSVSRDLSFITQKSSLLRSK